MNLQISHHLLLCVPQKTSSLCCDPAESKRSWEQLKLVLKRLKLEEPKRPEGIVLRSKVNCLRVCKSGPILLIWPEGIWYQYVFQDRIEAIVKSHIIEGKPKKEWVLKRTPLKGLGYKFDQPTPHNFIAPTSI